ncbi:unnamed protein product [Owenia fusiformis]|uniref:Nuclear pore complex protein Nup98-Nup96 n=1 Tax=Owenia fusiformis TaxID=6347 RepID=A0A8S4N9G9_OWEFU|nr:unnamed protein product [Owenia fusiformis]
MFGQNKTPFGGGTTSGFGATSTFGSSTPFGGGATTTFGAKTPNAGAFGTPGATSFGASTPAAGGLFGGTSGTTTGGLFGGATQSTGFGQTATSNSGFTFGATANNATSTGGLFAFGATANNGTSTGGLFGSSTGQTGTLGFSTPATSSAFGAKTPGGFGTTTQTGGLFGNTQTTTTGTSLFGNTTQTATGALFGGTATAGFGAAAPAGTTVKFNPVQGSDTMMKGGVSTQITIRHQCITAMKEYETKSLEELRVDDYLANRKGPQAGAAATGGMFGQTQAATGGFNLSQPKPTGFGASFGTSATSTASTGGLFGTTQQSGGLFGAQKTGFGTTTTTSSGGLFGGGFGNPSTSTAAGGLFGATQQAKPGGLFGASTSTQAGTLFGAGTSTQSTGFGATPGFGTAGATTGGFGATGFGTKTGFGTSTATTTGFGQPQQAAAGGFFGKPAATTAAGLTFGATNTFGNTSTAGGGLFGQKQTTGFGTGTAFGTGASTLGTGFGTGLATGTTGGLFGSQQKTALGGGLGTNLGTAGFGNTGFGTGLNTGLTAASQPTQLGSTDAQAAAAAQQTQQQLLALTTTPYGDNPLFRNIAQTGASRAEVLRPTNPVAQKAALSNGSSQYKVSPRPASKIKPKPLHSLANGKASLFDGLEEEDASFGNGTFVIRKSIKTLVIKKNSPGNLSSRSYSNDDTPRSPLNQSQTFSERMAARGEELQANLDDRDNRVSPERTAQSPMEAPTPDVIVGGKAIGQGLQDTPTGNRPHLDNTMNILNAKNNSAIHSTSATSLPEMDSAGEDNLSDEEEVPPHPAGIVLTRPDYYTIPSLQELASMVSDNGDCIVEDFAIGRTGYGSVYFPGYTNVANLNLDEIVHFRRKEVTIYPDDDNKPDEGEGLNKRAEVTLDCIWPNDKSTHKPIKDPSRLSLMNYTNKIEQASAKIGAKFIDYRPSTGSWVFEVKHFSKYGLVDDSDEEGDQIERDPKKLKQLKDAQEKSLIIQKQQIRFQQLQREKQQQMEQQQAQQQQQFVGMDDIDTDSNVAPQLVPASQKQPIREEDDTDMADITQEPFPVEEEYSGEEEEMMEQPVSSASQRLATNLGVNAKNVQVMKASFFGDEEEAYGTALPKAHAKPTNLSQSSFLPQNEASRRQGLFSSALKSQFASPVRASPKPRPYLNTSIAQDDAQSPALSLFSPRIIPPPRSTIQPVKEHPILPSGMPDQAPRKIVGSRIQRSLPDFADSLLYNNQSMVMDAGCFMGRSFRLGWGPSWHMANSGDPVLGEKQDSSRDGPFSILPGTKLTSQSRIGGSLFRVNVERLEVASYLQRNDSAIVGNCQSSLEIQLTHSEISTDETCPLFKPKIGVEALHDYNNLATDALHKLDSHPDQATAKHSKLVWGLCKALWGSLPGEDDEDPIDQRSYAHHMSRREELSRWLAAAAGEQVKQDTQQARFKGSDHLPVVFSHLLARQIPEACALAQESGDHRLALLLAQSMGPEIPRQIIEKQLCNWREIKADEHISEDRLKIYSLLSGHLVWHSTKGTVNVCNETDWKRCLAMHLWYQCSPTAGIADALRQYDEAYQGQTALGDYAAPPLPPYLEDSDAMEIENDKDREIRDTCYHLLKLYSDRSHPLEEILAPTTSTPNQLDYRLSWHLHQVLRSLEYSHVSDYHASSLSANFAAQLESLGLWQWAIFVLLHIKHEKSRASAVKDCLRRHITLSKSEEDLETEEFITQKLHIPMTWIHEAKAQKARSEGRFHDEAWHLLKAGFWNDSHRIILRHIASEAIINENEDYLRQFLDEIARPERSSTVHDWNIGGRVFLDYINLNAALEELKKGQPSAYDIERLQPEVTSLCNRVGNLACHNAHDRLCQSEMAKKTAVLLRTLLTLQGVAVKGTNIVPTKLLAPQVGKLPMPEDYALQELRELTRSYMLELTA